VIPCTRVQDVFAIALAVMQKNDRGIREAVGMSIAEKI
jgi:hypothetical protein